jgi:NHL repeat-containing protein
MRSAKPLTLVSAVLALVLLSPQVLLAQYAISTVAGGGPKHLTALNVAIGYPGSIALDQSGNTYIADSYSSNILKIDTTGNVTVVAGNGTFCPLTAAQCGDGGPATGASLNHPGGIYVDTLGNIFIADTFDEVVRAVNTGASAVTIAGVLIQPGFIATVAGNGIAGYSGDGGLATSAQLYDPYGVFVDSAENIFIADTDNCLIRKVSGANISTVAGNPLASPSPCGHNGDGGAATAQLAVPEGVFVDSTGNIFVADTGNNLIRVVNTGTASVTIAGVAIPAGNIITVAGTYYDYDITGLCQSSSSGAANTAYLCLPAGVFVDASENIFIADTDNLAIRAVNGGTAQVTLDQVVIQPGYIATVAGTLGMEGYSGDAGPAIGADLNYPNNIAVDASDDIFIADTHNFVVREVTASTGDIATTIGNNTLAYSGDGQAPVNAELNYPAAVFVDGSQDLFIIDTNNSVIRGVPVLTGIIQTLVGNGTECATPTATCGDGGLPNSAQLNNPYGIFLDASGNIFVADTEDNRIRVVNTQTTAITLGGVTIGPGNIATVAGTGTAGYLGDNGLATSAELAGPSSIFVDSAENIFIADTGNSVIREVVASSGNIITVAGNGTECAPPTALCGDGGPATGAQGANLAFPAGVFVDLSENIYIADTSDNRIRVVANPSAAQAVTIAGVAIQPGNIATVAGTGEEGYLGDGAAATSALLDNPSGLFVDIAGDVFFADTENNVIREVVAATGFIQTVAGNGTPGFAGDGGQSTGDTMQTAAAELYSPLGVFGNSAGDLFIADTSNQRIRALVPAIFVTVTPNPVNVAVSSQQLFTAAVTGISNTAVTWQVNGVAGGNSTVGTISTTGLYQAPVTIPSPATVTVTAIASDGTTSGSAQATIVGVGGAVTVTVSTSPAVTEVYTSTLQAFVATVTGTANTAVNWQVDGVPGGNATFGTIDTSGNYTGPANVPTPVTVTIEAVSQALSSVIGAESITIITEPSAAQPAPQTISAGATATYSLQLNENTGDPNHAITLSCLQSSLPPSAACSFASQSGATITTITPGAQAVPFSLTITVPSGMASLQQEKPDGMRLRFFVAFLPMAGILFADFGRRNKRRLRLSLAGLCVLLVLLNGCGGAASSSTSTNPELGTYNVKVQGTTSAQPNPVTITVVGLTVQ